MSSDLSIDQHALIDRKRADLVWAIQQRLRREGMDFYKPSPGQLPDHVHNRVARLAADVVEQMGHA